MANLVDIAVVNRSTVWPDAEAALVTAALGIQVNNHFAPAWGLNAMLTFVGTQETAPATHWWLTLLDNSDQAGALGYHEMTAAGLPLGKAFLKTTIGDKQSPSVCASHELLEMLADPWISDLVMSGDGSRLYAHEVCDACEADEFGYQINGILVSDFVVPTWFEGWRTTGHFDHMGHLTTGPFTLLPGGYIGYMNIQGGGWQQLTADREPRPQYRAHLGTRRERRGVAKDFWRRSDVPMK
jgi:hypothetical protein